MSMFPGNLKEFLEQAQRIQETIATAQAELEEKTVQASVGGGMVTSTVSGGGLLKRIEIDRSVVNPDDIEMLQDLIVAAVNEGVRKSKELLKEELSRHAGGLPLGQLFK